MTTMNRIPSLKGRFPFSFGVTSYLYPGDIEHNLKRLGGLADEMELILFEGRGYSNLPGPADIRRFARIAEKVEMRFNVHLPLDVDVVASDERMRSESLATVARIVELTHPLDPLSYTLHVLKDEKSEDARWKQRVRDSLSLIASPHNMFCIETLGWDLREIADIIGEFEFSVCIDVGHLLLTGSDVAEFFRAFSGKVRVVHLHGVSEGRDHISLAHLAPGTLQMIAETLRRDGYTRSLCLEVFMLQDFIDSIAPLTKYFSREAGG